jgi:hypothetical protein
MREGRGQKQSSFCEQATVKWPRGKEAKKLYLLGAGSGDRAGSYEKSFFASFFSKKEDSSCRLPSGLRP